MKRVVAGFLLLAVGLSVGLWLKVRQVQATQAGPSGGNGVIEGTEVDVTARMPARIVEVAVVEGDTVKKGQVVVELDCREPKAAAEAASARLKVVRSQAEAAKAMINAALGAARAAEAGVGARGAQVRALEVNRGAVGRQVTRVQKLQGEGGASAADLDKASTAAADLKEKLAALRAQGRMARGQVAAARAQAEAARRQAEAAVAGIEAAAADVKRTAVLVEECRLVAPMDGVVLTRTNEPGEVVLPGSRVLTLINLKQVTTSFYLPNRELAAAAPGKKVKVVADAYPGRSFAGTIRKVAARAEFTPRNVQTREDRDRLVYKVEVVLPNQKGELRPGMPVEVSILGTSRRGAGE